MIVVEPPILGGDAYKGTDVTVVCERSVPGRPTVVKATLRILLPRHAHPALPRRKRVQRTFLCFADTRYRLLPPNVGTTVWRLCRLNGLTE